MEWLYNALHGLHFSFFDSIHSFSCGYGMVSKHGTWYNLGLQIPQLRS